MYLDKFKTGLPRDGRFKRPQGEFKPGAARTVPCPRPSRTRPASQLLTGLIRVSQVNDFARCIKIIQCQARAGHGLAVDKESKSTMARLPTCQGPPDVK